MMTDTPAAPKPQDMWAFAGAVAARDRVLRPINEQIEQARQALRAIDHDHAVAAERIERDAEADLRVLLLTHCGPAAWHSATAGVFARQTQQMAAAEQEWQARRAPVALKLQALTASLAIHASAMPSLGGAR